MPEDMPDRMPENMPDRIPEDMPDGMPEGLPETKCINAMVGITRSKVIRIVFFFPTVNRQCRAHGLQNARISNGEVNS